MTEKQQERIRLKIKKIKSELAADKKRWGGFYDDSRGLRYLPLGYYIKLKDYSGGKRYINWFYKNFPDDGGFPEFLFECTIVLFYSKKLKEANRKLFETFSSNTYIIDKFLGDKISQIEKYEGSNIAGIEYLNCFNYTNADEDLSEFTNWLNETYNSDLFKSAANEHIDLQRQLKVEHEYERRVGLGKKMRALVDRF
ncbi:hypothetical protein [Tenacibaculum maritimum]|uniref:hypothetical protein n=1 Tax=Tenacibaculum maritimum TaxID=107401 RepID=UPI0012E58F0C|nr:hypothetical protein [Tenacibaculum maritimum]CAA0200799.1 conserved hypothetical protein [Tenacibaculum maritimum]CAA0238028.1 conserved hypothetical protein [Tenacibaculum maritimum]